MDGEVAALIEETRHIIKPIITNKDRKLFLILIFFLGIGSKYYFLAVGQLYVTEFLLVCLFPFLWIQNKQALQNLLVKKIRYWGILWFLSQVTTDLIRRTPSDDFIRGWAGIFVFLVSFQSLYLLLKGNLSRIKIYLFGCVIGGILQPFIQPNIYFIVDPWKFGFGSPIILFVILVIVSFYGGKVAKMRTWFIPLVALGGISFYLNTRSIGAVVLVTAFIMLFSEKKIIKRNFSKPIRLPLLIFLTGVVLGLGLGVINIYGYVVDQGWLGETARTKYYTQMGGTGALSLILGGRPELLSSYYAILDSPFIGHGSWPREPEYGVKTYEKLMEMGYEKSLAEYKIDLYLSEKLNTIPAHSHLLQAWVWAGLLGAIFWILISSLVIKSMYKSYLNPGPFFILTIYLGLVSGWDILFSPFNAFMRLEWCIRLVIFIIALLTPLQKEYDKTDLYFNPE